MSRGAELGNCDPMLYEADLADGDTCTSALTLFNEGHSFAKLAYYSAQVRRARIRQQ